MKRTVLVVLFLLSGVFTIDALAQTIWATGSLAVNATVVAGITVEATTPMDFGTVTMGGASSTISPTTASAGHVTINGPASAAILVTVTTPTSLVNGASSIPVGTWQKKGAAAASSQSSATSVPSDGRVSLSPTGQYHLWFGATISPNTTVTTLEGVHTGNITVQVSYQ